MILPHLNLTLGTGRRSPDADAEVHARALAVALLATTPALAQTAAVDAPVSSAADPALDAQISSYLNAPSRPLPTVRDGVVGPEDAPAPDRKVHGEVGVGIGTGGYREAYASMIAPVGQNGTVAVAVSQGRGRGLYGGEGSRQSLSMAGAFRPGLGSGAALGHAVACGTSAGKGELEPPWVARMQAANPAAPTEPACAARP